MTSFYSRPGNPTRFILVNARNVLLVDLTYKSMNIKQVATLTDVDDLIYDTHYSKTTDVLSYLSYEESSSLYLNKMSF